MANLQDIYTRRQQTYSDAVKRRISQDIDPFLHQISPDEKVYDGDTTSAGRYIGYDTYESADSGKADRLEGLGLTKPKQKELGLAGKSQFTDYLKQNVGALATKRGTDVYGRTLLDSPELAEHMVKSGVAVPTDRYNEKLQGLARATEEKLHKLDPKTAEAYRIQREYNIDRQKPGFFERAADSVDALQSGTQQALVGTADFVLDAVTPGDNTLLNKAKSAEYANQVWGYDNKEANFAKKEALHKFKNEDYVGAVGEMVKSPELWGESIPMIAEMGIGFGKFTALGKGLKAATAGLKGAEKAAAADKAKAGATMMEKIAYTGANNAGYLATIGDQTNRHIEEFTQNNNGVGPSYTQIAEMTAMNALQLGLDRFAFGQLVATKGGIDALKDTVAPMLKFVPDSQLGVIGKQVAKSVTGVAAAMGTEAAQEYVQSWAELLNTRAGTTKYGDWLDVLKNPESQDEAIIGALAGAGMGGQMRAPIEAYGVGKAVLNVKGQALADKIQALATDRSAESVANEPVVPAEGAKPKNKLESPDTYITSLNEVEQAELVNGTLTEDMKAEIAGERKFWVDVKGAIGDKDVYTVLKQELDTTTDQERKGYLADVLKQADQRLVKPKFKTITEALKSIDMNDGLNLAQGYTHAINIINPHVKTGIGEDSPLATVASILKANDDLDMYHEMTGIKRPVKPKEDALYEQAANVIQTKVKGLLDSQGFAAMSDDEKIDSIASVTDTLLANIDGNSEQYREAVSKAVLGMFAEDRSFGSGPVSSTPKEPFSFNIGTNTETGEKITETVKTGAVGSKKPFSFNAGEQTRTEAKAQVKEAVKQKVKELEEDIVVEDMSTDTHASVSARSIKKLAKALKLPAVKVQAALDIAFQKLLIKKMGKVSKEADTAQYNVYHGEHGILTNFLKYKKALQDSKIDEATEAWSHIVDRYVGQRYKADMALDSIEPIQEKIHQMWKDGMSIEDIKSALKDVRIGVQGAKSGDIVGHLTGLDILKLTKEVPEDVRNEIEFSKSGHILEAEIESANHIETMADREGYALPEVSFKKVERAELRNKIVAKAKEVEGQIEELEKASKDAFQEMTKEELKEHSALRNKVEKLKAELEGHLADIKKQEKFAESNDYQYTDITFKPEVDVSGKLGQTAGTVTAEEAERLGIAEDRVEEFVPTKTLDQYAELLKELEKLKKQRAQLATEKRSKSEGMDEQKEVAAQLYKEIAEAEKALGKEVVAPIAKAARNAHTADKTVRDITDRLKKSKKALKDLRAAEAFLDNNRQVFDGVAIDIVEFVKIQQDFEKWLTKEGRNASIQEQNKKLQELAASNTVIEKIVTNLNKVGKYGVVLARRLMGLGKLEIGQNVYNQVSKEITKLVIQIEEDEKALPAAKEKRKAAVKEAVNKIVKFRKDTGTNYETSLSKKQIADALMHATRMKRLKDRLHKAKGLSREKVQAITAQIKAIEAQLRGIAVFKSMLNDNLSMIKGLPVEYAKPGEESRVNTLDFKTLLDSKGSMLANLGVAQVVGLFDVNSPARKFLENIVSTTATTIENTFYTGVIATKEKAGELLAQNPALMLLAHIEESDKGFKFVYDPAMMQALRLVTKNYLAISRSDLNWNANEDIAKIIGVSEYDYKSIAKANGLRKRGQLLTVTAARIGDDFLRAMGIKQNKVGEEAYRKLAADLGNTALKMAESQGEIEFKEATSEEWKAWTGKKMDEKATVKFIHVNDEKMKEARKTEKVETAAVREIEKVLDSLNKQASYRTDPVFATLTNKEYKIDGSPNKVPEKSQEVLRALEDQEHKLVLPVVEMFVNAVKKNPEGILARSGWKKLGPETLAYDREAQDSKNRELETTASKLVEMYEALQNGEISDTVFFNWFFSTNGRYMIDAVGVNPQADKHWTRWMLLPKEAVDAVWDTTNDKVKRLMHDGIAQAFGWDIDKKHPDDTAAFAERVMEVYKKDPKTFTDAVLDNTIDKIVEGAKMPHTSHALLAVEFMKNKGSKTRFRGTLVAEYDAKTSGPEHKIMQWPILKDENGEDITSEWLGKGAIITEGNEFTGGSSAAHIEKTRDGYQTVTVGANAYLDSISPKDDKRDFTKVYGKLRSLVKPLTKITGELEEVEKEGRELGKQAFVPFGYGSSTKSIQNNVGLKLAFDILRKVVDPKDEEAHAIVKDVLKLTDAKFAELQKALRETADLSQVKLETFGITKAIMDSGEKSVLGALADMFSMTYGEAYKNAMEDKFSEHVKINNVIKSITSSMFRMWKIKYDAKLAKEPNATVERKMEMIRELEEYFPMIKAPWSESRIDKSDSLAIFDTKRASMKHEVLPGVSTTIKKGDSFSSAAVQAMIMEMEEVFAAGAVLPIHWIDATQIGTVLREGGVHGIHDAMVLGIPTEAGIGKIQQMNKAMYDINANYNLIAEFQASYLNMLNNMTDEDVDAFVAAELEKVKANKKYEPLDLADIKETLGKIVDNVNAGRKEYYSKGMIVGNIIAFEGTEYDNRADLNNYKDLDKTIESLFKGCE